MGNEVVETCLINDRGLHICKSMVAYKKFGNDIEPDIKGDHFVGNYYIEFEKQLKNRADEYFKGNTKDADSLEKIKKIIEEHRGFIKVPWCSTEKEGEECADILKADTQGGVVSGTKFESPEKPKKGQKCAICGKPAKHIVYVAKSY